MRRFEKKMDVRRDETRREEKRQQLTIRGKITIDNKRIDEMTREKKREFMSFNRQTR